MTYTVNDINKQFTKIVSDYLKNGYTIYTNTMGGSQGEKASIHFLSPDQKFAVRLSLERFSDWHEASEGFEIKAREYPASELRCKDELCGLGDILWANKSGVTIVKFYNLSWPIQKFFGDKEEFIVARDKRNIRSENRRSNYSKINITSDKSREVVYPWVCKQPKCKSVKPADIKAILKLQTVKNGTTVRCYQIELKNKTLCLTA